MPKPDPVAAREFRPLTLSLLAVGVGIVAGFGAVVFRGLIAVFHNVLFLGKLSYAYDANVHTAASPWGGFVILVPVVGALGVVFLVKNFAPEAKGHGVPEVMDAIYYNRGIIRPIVAVIKSLASALCIGSGGSVGREGPIIQIGASFGSTLGQILKTATWQRITMIAAGAGGGIAATFNTPIGGILFAVEIMLHEVSVRTLVPVSIATITATYIGRIFFGVHPSFVVPALETNYFHLTNPLSFIAYIGLGAILGLVSAVFIRSIYAFEDFFEGRVRGGYYVRHLSGMLIVGVIMYLMFRFFGHYYIEGVGYATVQDVLSGRLTPLYLLLLLFALKLFAVSLTLGSGASGGIFSPGLFMGATLGGAYGIGLGMLFPSLDIAPAAFGVAGMAGVIGGSTGAAMAAIIMIFEMTLDHNVIMPMTITVAVSYAVRRALTKETIYTLKLVRRGHYMPEALQANFHHLTPASEILTTSMVTVPVSMTMKDFSQVLFRDPEVAVYLLEEDGEVVSVLSWENALERLQRRSENPPRQLRDLDRQAFVTIRGETRVIDIMRSLRHNRASFALVTEAPGPPAAGSVKGVITRERIEENLEEALSIFSE